jgi:hypothetical protein
MPTERMAYVYLLLLHILCRQQLLHHQPQVLLSSRTKLLPVQQDKRVQAAARRTLHRQCPDVEAACRGCCCCCCCV